MGKTYYILIYLGLQLVDIYTQPALSPDHAIALLRRSQKLYRRNRAGYSFVVQKPHSSAV